MEIGSISFIVPEVVKNELTKLQQIPEKTQEITQTLNFIKKFIKQKNQNIFRRYKRSLGENKTTCGK